MKPYPVYKESGVEWLGPVPEGWEVKRLKTELHEIDIRAEDQSFELLGLSKTRGIVLRSSLSQGAAGADDYRKYKVVRCGDLVMNKMQAWNGVFGLSPFDGIVSPDYSVFRVRRPVFSSFVTEALRTDVAAGEMFTRCRGMGTAFLRLNTSDFLDVHLAFPPSGEVERISAFLDRETAKIDGLIEEQRRLIALLAEKRQATISHAVTRGLNPSVRLKPSGVDWLGDVPEGWDVVRLRRIIDSIEQGFSPECFAYPAADQDWGVLKAGCVNRGTYNEIENKTLPPEIEPRPELEVQSGDLLMSRASGSPDLIGSVALVRNTQGKIMLSDKIFRLNLEHGVDKEFFALSMASLPMRTQIVNAISGREGMANNLPQREIKNFWFALPPEKEQVEIARYLQHVTADLDALIETASSAIALLQERRAALISAAVTGKIDVREAQASPVQTRKSLSVSVLLGGVIIAALGRHASMGRMLVQKHLFMAEAHAGVSELQGRYDRQAAGPYDAALQRRVEADLVAAGLLRVAQDGGPGSRVDYEFLGDAAALRADLALVLGDRMARFDDTFHQLAKLSKPGIEAVATLYAAWNDFLMNGKEPSRSDIILEALKNWHPEKAEKFTKADLDTWLDWMDRHEILPTGTGPKTQTGRLFT